MKARRPNSRTVPLGAKFSPAEADDIRQKAHDSGTTVSTLLHGLSTKGVVHPRPRIDPIAIEQWRALAPVASNLNQLTRSVNQGCVVNSTDVSDELTLLRNILADIRDSLMGQRRTAA